jgi:CheY-like chemotaxis protein
MGNETITVLLIEDDENDVTLIELALKQAKIPVRLRAVGDGLEGLNYLNGTGQFSDRERFPIPEIIILDLKMPRMSGMEFLSYINDHPGLRIIPTIVMSASKLDADVLRAYQLGANSFMVKPNDPATLTQMVKIIQEFWSLSEKPKPFTGHP